jgi:hypothetical protein
MSVHVAKSGAKEGQWVTCPAKKECRNGGKHVEAITVTLTQDWKNDDAAQKTKKKDITLKDVEDFEALPQEMKDAYAKHREEEDRVYNLPENVQARQRKSQAAYNKRQERLGYPDRAMIRQIEDHWRKEEEKVNAPRVLKARAPLIDSEREVTATHVTFDNGFVGERALYSAETQRKAVVAKNEISRVFAVSQDRALTPQEADAHIATLRKNNGFNFNERGQSLYRSYLLAAPGDAMYQEALVAENLRLIAFSTAVDKAYGYKDGTFEAYGKSKKSRKKTVKAAEPKPEAKKPEAEQAPSAAPSGGRPRIVNEDKLPEGYTPPAARLAKTVAGFFKR